MTFWFTWGLGATYVLVLAAIYETIAYLYKVEAGDWADFFADLCSKDGEIAIQIYTYYSLGLFYCKQ